MILKYYFLLLQLLVIISYFFITESDWKSEKYALFENKYIYSIVIAAALIVGINYNLDYQLFCNPVTWTYWILIPVAIWLVLFPHLVGINLLKGFNSIFCGFSLSVLGYILLFGGTSYLLMLIGVSLLGVPVFWYSKRLKKRKNKFLYDWINFYTITFFAPLYLFFLLITRFRTFNKFLVAAPIIGILSFALFSTIRMNELENLALNSGLDEQKITAIKNNPLDQYYLELVLGQHWKYHTRMTVVDGWRPPFHDPTIGIRRWFNTFRLGERQELNHHAKEIYKQVFPEKATEFKCRCAKNMVWIN